MPLVTVTTKTMQYAGWYMESPADFIPCMQTLLSTPEIGYTSNLVTSKDIQGTERWDLGISAPQGNSNFAVIKATVTDLLVWDGVSLTCYSQAEAQERFTIT